MNLEHPDNLWDWTAHHFKEAHNDKKPESYFAGMRCLATLERMYTLQREAATKYDKSLEQICELRQDNASLRVVNDRLRLQIEESKKRFSGEEIV